MKNAMLFGVLLGAAVTSAVYTGAGSRNTMKKAKRAFINKVEDMIM